MSIVRFIVNCYIPVRLNLGIMMFMACFSSYMLRVNISINILAMTRPTPVTTGRTSTVMMATHIYLNETLMRKIAENFVSPSTTYVVPNYGPRYNWSARDQSVLLGAYFWGYLITSLPAGMMAKTFGETNIVGWSMAFSALFTGLCPLAASINFWSIFSIRFLLGVVGGLLYPCLHNLIAAWCPPDEKGKFISALMGGTLGTVVTWPLAGIIVETMGWEYAFYIPALFTSFITLLWFVLVADTPAKHTNITLEEKLYIENSLENNVVRHKNVLPPVMYLFTSPPFWALLLLHYGNLWGLNFLITAAPKFMSEILKFNFSNAGILSSLPYLVRMINGFIFGAVGDVVRRKSNLNVTNIRKMFCICSHILPGLLLVAVGYVGFDPFWCVFLITLSLGFNGASTMTNLQNSQDLAPNYAGTLYGIINFVGTTSGFLSPLLVAYFTEEQSTTEEWKKIFVIGAIVYIIPGIVFLFFGSGKIQKWNDTTITKFTLPDLEATNTNPKPKEEEKTIAPTVEMTKF